MHIADIITTAAITLIAITATPTVIVTVATITTIVACIITITATGETYRVVAVAGTGSETPNALSRGGTERRRKRS